jgi:hypothetical protein
VPSCRLYAELYATPVRWFGMLSCCYTSETVWYASGIVENMYGCDDMGEHVMQV